MPFKNHKREFQKQTAAEILISKIPENVLLKLNISREKLIDIAKAFHGRLSFKDTPGYEQDAHANPLFAEHPNIIAFCNNWKDVRFALQLACDNKWPFVCRSGGHSTAGFSLNNGMVIDISGMNDVVVDPSAMQMTVGAGASWGKINAMLDIYQLHVPGGGCSSVGVAGYMQGGGYGFTARQLGMNCDSVLEVVVMLADGNIVVANDKKNQDLFWAIRGGTGGNFGILLQIKYQLFQLHKFWGFVLQWPLQSAPSALEIIQANYMKGKNDAKVNYQLAIATLSNGNDRALVMMGMYDGTPDEGKKALKILLNTEGVSIKFEGTDSYDNLGNALFADLNPPDPDSVELKKSGYISRIVSSEEWKSVVDSFSRTNNKYNIIGIEPYGGAINTTEVSNSFVHRDMHMNLFFDSFFDEKGISSSKDQAVEWFNQLAKTLTPLFDGQVYQNYPERNFPNFRWAYWGNTFNSLLFVKKKFDPHNLFHFEQSITPCDPSNTQIICDQNPSIFEAPDIQYGL